MVISWAIWNPILVRGWRFELSTDICDALFRFLHAQVNSGGDLFSISPTQ